MINGIKRGLITEFKWWIVKQGIPKEKLQLLDVTGDDLAHYSKSTG